MRRSARPGSWGSRWIPQGLAWQPNSGQLFSTEHGTDGVNELNAIVKGGNYGWPIERRGEEHPDFIDPILTHDGPPARRAEARLSERRSDRAAPGRRTGRLRAITQGPDGYLYITTSNRDGRGDPGPNDDRVVRLLPIGGSR